MQTPPAHVLARLDDIIVGQEETKEGGGTPPRHVLLQNCDDDDDDAAFGIESSASSFSSNRRWKAQYTDANSKLRNIGYFDTQEDAAHAVNAAIRRAGLEGRRKTNPVVDGQLVPPARKRKYRSEEPAATPSPRARRR